MLIVSANISDILTMTESAANIEDLEDGEIESDGEDISAILKEKREEYRQLENESLSQEKMQPNDMFYPKQGKKKKSKSLKAEQKLKKKKNRKYVIPTEEDFAGNIEKAIRKAMNKNDEEDFITEEQLDEKKKYKKRKKYDGKDGVNKKRKKHDFSDDVDESEMMCVRGASPLHRHSPMGVYDDEDGDSYDSDSSHEDNRGNQQQQRRRPPQRDRSKNNKNDRRRGAHPLQDPDGVCVYFMQGKCHKGDDCIFSHDAQPPRKMELCKFYLMDCCAKRDKCLYMHADFPCKYFHTGLPCIHKDDCKFAHGKPLNENLKNILLKHLESAPKEILGDFPRLNREDAIKLMQSTQAKLIQQYAENTDGQDKNIPSLFEISVSNPQNTPDSSQLQQGNERSNKISPKIRHSRWQNDSSNNNYNLNVSPDSNNAGTNVLSIKNLTGVLTPRQISDLSKMGIGNLDQLGQLTVIQLNNIGISAKQITEIQLNTMSIQKLGLIQSGNEQQTQFLGAVSSKKDLDLRVPPPAPSLKILPVPELPGKDVDMRFQSSGTVVEDNCIKNAEIKPDYRPNKDLIDIDQYTKDALKFATQDKDNDVSNETYSNDKSVHTNETKDVDHRVLPFSNESSTKVIPSFDKNTVTKERDVDIRFLQPEPLFKYPEKRHRRSTTDDEDNNLLIDEKWYSSDEEKGSKKKSPASSPRTSLSPQAAVTRSMEPSAVLSQLVDLSKIDISENVTKILNTMRNNLQENKVETNIEAISSPKSRDPRSRRSPEKINDSNKSSKKTPRVSIYECVDGEPTDGRRRSDVDLRKTEYNLPSFGDTDLRQGTSGDIDFRLGLPFKAIPNYTPASEIDGSINSHPPMVFKVVPIDIPRPDYTDIRNTTAKSQALLDPRLRKVFRLSLDESNTSNSDSEKTTKVTPAATGPRIDPRRKPKETGDSVTQDQKTSSLDMQTILQNSNWYKEMSSTQKIFVNQHLAPITQMIKQYHQDKTSSKTFDLTTVQSNSILCNIFTNLGVSLGESGEFSYLPKPKEALLKTPSNYGQNSNPFGMNSNLPGSGMDPNNINLMNIPPMNMGGGMNNMNLGHMQNYNQPFPDPRGGPGPAPGLLGIAPNIPHSFNNNFGNMGFNGPGQGNEYNYDGEQNYQRFPNRGHRGRGGERWNRGGRGHQNRKNFNDRGSWKH